MKNQDGYRNHIGIRMRLIYAYSSLFLILNLENQIILVLVSIFCNYKDYPLKLRQVETIFV